MILEKTKDIKICNRNITYYKKIGFNINIDSIINVNIFDIPKYSRIKIFLMEYNQCH